MEQNLTPRCCPMRRNEQQNTLDFTMKWFISVFDSLHDEILIADRNEIVRYNQLVVRAE
jgi:hypothetical protein